VHVLVTNDDGIDSPGLAVLVATARAAGHDVTVAAPAREYSGASASLHGAQEDGSLAVTERTPPGVPDDVPSYAVGAAPALIAYYGAFGAFGRRPDLLLSGVNRGQNTGHLVLHSGTAGAAMAGALHGIRGIAVSLASSAPRHWDTAGAVLAPVLAWAQEHAPTDRVLNLNVPDLPPERVRGLRRAPLARLGAVQATVDRTGGALRLTYADVETFAGADARTDEEIDPDAPSPTGELPTDSVLLAHGWATLTQLRAPADDPDAPLPSWDGPPPAR
jgi:5'-nucleotidase